MKLGAVVGGDRSGTLAMPAHQVDGALCCLLCGSGLEFADQEIFCAPRVTMQCGLSVPKTVSIFQWPT